MDTVAVAQSHTKPRVSKGIRPPNAALDSSARPPRMAPRLATRLIIVTSRVIAPRIATVVRWYEAV